MNWNVCVCVCVRALCISDITFVCILSVMACRCTCAIYYASVYVPRRRGVYWFAAVVNMQIYLSKTRPILLFVCRRGTMCEFPKAKWKTIIRTTMTTTTIVVNGKPCRFVGAFVRIVPYSPPAFESNLNAWFRDFQC